MAVLPGLAICVCLLGASFAVTTVTGDGTSEGEMREIRLLLNKYGTQIESLQRENARLEEKTMTLEKKTITLEEKIATLEEKITTLEDKSPTFQEQHLPKADRVDINKPGTGLLSNRRTRSTKGNPDEAVKTINTRVDSSTDSIIAFHAILSHQINDPATKHIVLFDHIITNIGGHFSSITGVFTCNEVGVYYFSWTIKVYNNQWVTTELVRDGVVIGTAMSGDAGFWTTGTASALTMLAPGNQVWVRIANDHTSGADIYPTFTMFNGFMIH